MIFLLKRKAVMTAMLCMVAGIAVGVGIRYFPQKSTLGSDSGTLRVIVDAGHGYPDGGAVGADGTQEKDINLAIARKLEEVLCGKSIEVVMTRIDDNGLQDDGLKTIREMKRSDMNKRLNIMKNSSADLFISIHMNYFEKESANGLHIFYAQNHPEAEPLAASIQERMSGITGAAAHTVKTADKSLFLMKKPPLPAILVECGFMSNREEIKKLKNDDYQSRIAWAIADSIEKYYKRS
jgi:N-acetylmuramoyl-L-alanine amidase